MKSIKVLSFLAIILLLFSFFIILKDYEHLEESNTSTSFIKSEITPVTRAVFVHKKEDKIIKDENKTLKDSGIDLSKWYFEAYQFYKNQKYLNSYKLIKRAIKKGNNLNNAKIAFIKFIEKNEKEFEAYEFLSYLNLFDKEFDSSLDILQKAKEKSSKKEYFLEKMILVDFMKLMQYKVKNLEANKDDFTVYYFSLYKLHLYDEAIEFFKDLRDYQRDEEFIKEIIKFHIEQNSYKKALEFLEELDIIDTKLYTILKELKETIEEISTSEFDDKKFNKLMSLLDNDKLNGVVSDEKMVDIGEYIIKKHPNNSYSYLFLSFAKIYNKDIEGAIDSAKKSIDLKTKEGVNYLILALLYISKNAFDRAKEVYSEMLKDDIVFSKELDDKKAMSTIMKYFYAKGEYNRIIEYYAKNPDKMTKRDINLVSKVYLQKKQYQNAIEFVKKYDGEDTYLLNKIKDNIEEIKDFENKIFDNPNNTQTYLTFLEKNIISKEDSVKLYEKAISENPNEASLYLNYAKYITKIRLKEISTDNILLDESPYNYFDETKVVMLYKKAIELEPNSEENYKKLADIYYHKKNFKEAKRYYELEKELNPNKKVSSALVNIYLEEGEFDKILELSGFEEIKEQIKDLVVNGDNAKYYYNLALFYYKSNKKPQAFQSYKKAKSLNQDILVVIE